MGKVRFSHFDSQVQSSKKVVLATEKNVFAALNTRTGDLCEYFLLFFILVTAENNLAPYVEIGKYVQTYIYINVLQPGDM